jgi:hypothetical protein
VRDEETLLVAAATFITAVHAGGCDEETIGRVARGGSVVILDSGGVYKVAPDDTPDTVLWNAGDDILLCGDENDQQGQWRQGACNAGAIKPIDVWSELYATAAAFCRNRGDGSIALALFRLLFDY